MARYSNVQTNFSGGLITDNLAGRTDLARTANSCRALDNFLPTLQGPATYRQGFKNHVVEADNADTEVVQTTVVLATSSKYRVKFTSFEAAIYDVNGTLKDTVVTPYSSNELKDLRFSSETDILYITHPSHRPRYLQADITFEFLNLQSTESTNPDTFKDLITAAPESAQLRARVSFSGDTSWSLTEIDTFIEPFLEDDTSDVKMSITKGREVVKVVSSTSDFSDIYTDYSGNGNSFTKDWYVEYELKGIKLLGLVVDSALNYPEVSGPSADGTTVYIDAVDAVTTIEDTAAKLYLLDNNETTAEIDIDKLEKDDVPEDEVHLRSDTAVFNGSIVNSFIRVPNDQQSPNIVVGHNRTTSRWVKVSEYLGTEPHPVEFYRGLNILTDTSFYDYGSVYKSYGGAEFEIDSVSNTATAKVEPSGNRTFSWTGGSFAHITDPPGATADDVIGNLSTAKAMDVIKCDPDFLIETGNNLIITTGQTTVTEIANDVQVTVTDSTFFDSDKVVGRYIKGKMPSGMVYMKILQWYNGGQVRALLRSPVPVTPKQEYENSGVFESFAMGAWYENNYPRAVAKYERRRFYGGTYTHPNFLFVSKINDETNFAPTEDDGTVLDTNGFTYPLGNVNASIRWLLAAEDLIIGTSQGIFRIVPNQYDAAVSPKTIRISLVDDVNCKGEAVLIGTSVFFPDESSTQLMEYRYDANIQRFNANDLAKFIYPTFVQDPIKRIAVQEAPQARIWVLTESGLLYTLVYQRHEDYYAWAKHPLTKKDRTTQAPVHDITVIREGYSTGQDMVVIAISRSSTSAKTYEVLNDESATGVDAVFLDASETFDIAPTGLNYDSGTGELLIDTSIYSLFSSGDELGVVLDSVYYGTLSGVDTVVVNEQGIEATFDSSEGYTAGLLTNHPDWDGLATNSTAQWQADPTNGRITCTGNFKNIRTTDRVTASDGDVVRLSGRFDFGSNSLTADDERVFMFSLADMDAVGVEQNENVLQNPNLSFSVKFQDVGGTPRLRLINQENNQVLGTMDLADAEGDDLEFEIQSNVGSSAALTQTDVTLRSITDGTEISGTVTGVTEDFYDGLTKLGVKASFQCGELVDTTATQVNINSTYFRNVTTFGTETVNNYIRIPMQNSLVPINVTLGIPYTGRIQPMYPTWDGRNRPSFGADEIRVVSARVYVISSSTYKFGVGDDKETIELEGFVTTDDKSADATKRQVQFTGFDREKPVVGSYFGVDKVPEIVQDSANELTIAALITKTDLN